MTVWRDIKTDPPPKPATLGVIQLLLGNCEKRWIRMGRFYPEVGKWYYSGTNERSQWSEVEGDGPTHWMPLPAPPQGKDNL